MKKISVIFSISIVLIFLTLLGIVTLNILRAFFTSLGNLNQNQTTLLIALIPSTISILGVIFASNLQKSRELDFKNREKKENAYNSFLEILYDFIAQGVSKKTQEDLTLQLMKARKDLVLWGSDEVVKLYSGMMTITQETPEDNPNKNLDINSQIEKTILAIRKDLGYKNTKLEIGDLQRYFR